MTASEREEIKQDVFERLKKVLTNLLKILREKDPEKRPTLTWETDLFDDLGVDSMDSMDLMNALEDEFQVSPNLNVAASKRQLHQVVDYIIELQEKKKAQR